MYNNLHFHQILRHTKPEVPKFKMRQYLQGSQRIFMPRAAQLYQIYRQ